jgi:DnaA family protein
MTQLLLGIVPDWLPTLDNFVPGHNGELLALLRQALVGEGERSLYLWGEPGCGKTHLLHAVVAAAQDLGLSVEYASGRVPGVADMVAVDDVERLDATAQVELFALYNRMRERGGLLLTSGQAAPRQLELRDDLRTRLGWGLVYAVHTLTDAEKAEALQRHAQGKGCRVPDDVVHYLLRHGSRSLNSLLGMLDALDERSLRLHRPISVPLLREVMQDASQMRLPEL